LKKNIIMRKSILGLFLITLIISSCRKYSDGPSFSLLTKKARLCNDWVLLTQLKNDEDVTDDAVTVKLNIENDGTYSISSTYDALGQLQGDYSNGKWTFGDTKDILYLYENVNNQYDDEPSRTFKIKELRNKQIKLVEEFPSIDLYNTYIYVQD
jgi:hypothetical protein